MKEVTHIPEYTINQIVYVANFDDFSIERGVIAERHIDEDDNYLYVFKNDRYKVEYEEENLFKTFREAKNYMEDIVQVTLQDVRRLNKQDVREI
jgi:hypothetical protein